MRLRIVFTCLLLTLIANVSVNASSNYSEFGESQLPIWNPLTKFEKQTLASISRAKRGDADALLKLYLLASGDIRHEREYLVIRDTLEDWLKQIEPKIARDSQPWRQGYKLHRAMHQRFFLGGNVGDNAGQGYDFEQSKLSEVFRSKKFNCVSASMLFAYAAKKMDFDVSGVLLPSHVFIELKFEKSKKIEVETTSASGYDWLHDEAFYEQRESQEWFSTRGLEPSNYQDYLNREIISPFELGVQNMKNQHVRPERMVYRDRMRLVEILSELSPDDIKAHKARLSFYFREYNQLREQSKFAVLDKMYLHIEPYLNRVKQTYFNDIDLENMLAWVDSQRSLVAINNGREEEGVRLANEQLVMLNPNIEDYDKIKNNLYYALAKFIEKKISSKQFSDAKFAFNGNEINCVTEQACANNLRHLYSRWASYFWERAEWPTVIDRYQEYLSYDSAGETAELFRANMQSAYLNWSNAFAKDSDWLGASEVLRQCQQSMADADRCDLRLQKLQESHGLD